MNTRPLLMLCPLPLLVALSGCATTAPQPVAVACPAPQPVPAALMLPPPPPLHSALRTQSLLFESPSKPTPASASSVRK